MDSQVAPSTQTTWPGAFGLYKQAAQAAKNNGWTLLGLIAISLVVSIAASGYEKTSVGWLFQLINFVVSIFIQIALVFVYLAGARGSKMAMGEALQQASSRFVDAFIAIVLTALLIVASLLALVVPFFFVLPRLILVPYFLIDKKLGPVDSIKESWDKSKGFSVKVWGVLGATILFGLLCVVLIGFYFSFMYQTAFVLLYFYITGQSIAVPAISKKVDPTPVSKA